MKMLKKILPAVLIILLTVFVGTFSSFAAQSEQEITLNWNLNDTVCIEDVSGKTSDELLELYFEKNACSAATTTVEKHSSRDLLNSHEQFFYDKLETGLQTVLDGKTTSTSFVIETSFLSWTKAQLGCNTVVQNGNLTEEAATAIKLKLEQTFDSNKIMQALLSDCEYELFWFDKTEGMGVTPAQGGMSYNPNTTTLSITKVVFSFTVAADFAPTGETENHFLLDAQKISCIDTAINNAQAVLEANAAKTDLEKLTAYCDYICDNVSYFEGYSTTSYGHPWQMIYVFDGNSSTNVVCEGYAKAFKYLCDKSTFEDAACYLVTGTMQANDEKAEPHMWNTVFSHGKYYLADITNCDEGTVGSPKGLFLVGAVSEQDHLVHKIQLSKRMTYTYDPNHLGNYCSEDQFYNISSTSYAEDLANQYIVTVIDGIGSGKYFGGSDVTIRANSASQNTVFSHWEVTSGNLTIADNKVSPLTFTMPKENITITAIYHTHNFNSWGSNENQHWKECDCGTKSNFANHTYKTWVSTSADCHWKTCECGKEGEHVAHNYNSEWKHSALQHWKECECTREGTKTTHTYSSEWQTSATEHWKECECGFHNTHESHEYISALQKDETTHWKECECGQRGEISTHEYTHSWTADADGHSGNCICGATSKKVPHSYSGGWFNNENEHWQICECGTKSATSQHDFTFEYTSTDTHHTGICECGKESDNSQEHVPGEKLFFDEESHYRLCICGTKLDEEAHTSSDAWSNDDDAHWHLCKCGYAIDYAEHEFIQSITKEPSCSEEGSATYSCVCGYSTETALNKTDHEYDSGVITKEATKSELGIITYTCKHCPESYEYTFSAEFDENVASTDTDKADTDKADTDSTDSAGNENSTGTSEGDVNTETQKAPTESQTGNLTETTPNDSNTATENVDNDKDESGCSSAIAPTTLAMACIIGLAFTIKKKKENE